MSSKDATSTHLDLLLFFSHSFISTCSLNNDSTCHVIGVVFLMMAIFPPSQVEKLKYNTSIIQICLIFDPRFVSRRAVKRQRGYGDVSSHRFPEK